MFSFFCFFFFLWSPYGRSDAQRASNFELNELKNNNTIDCRLFVYCRYIILYKKLIVHDTWNIVQYSKRKHRKIHSKIIWYFLCSSECYFKILRYSHKNIFKAFTFLNVNIKYNKAKISKKSIFMAFNNNIFIFTRMKIDQVT